MGSSHLYDKRWGPGGGGVGDDPVIPVAQELLEYDFLWVG